MLSSSAPAVGYVYTSIRPGGPLSAASSAGGTRSRWARTASAGSRGRGIRRVSSRVAASRAGRERREVPSTSTGAGVPSARGNAWGKSRMPLMSAPRKA